MNELEALATLIGGYLNEDWPEEYGDPWTAVGAFVRNEPDYAPFVRSDIEQLVRQPITDQEVEDGLAMFGLGYRPSVDGSVTYRAWLMNVADRVDALLRKSPAA